MPKWLTPEEVAEVFRIKRVRTIYEWIANGDFPKTICINRQYRVSQADVDDLIQRSKVSGVCPSPTPAKRRVISRGVQ